MNFVHQRVEAKLAGDLALAEERKWPLRYESVEAATICLDVAAIAIAGICTGILYRTGEGTRLDLGQALGSAALVSTLFGLSFKSQGLYRPAELRKLPRQIRQVFATWAMVFFLLAGVIFLLKVGSELSRGTTLLFAGFSLVALVANRMLVRELLTRGIADRRFSGRKIVLITDPELAHESPLKHKLAAIGFDITGDFALPPRGTSPNLRRRLMAAVIEHIGGSDVEEVFVTTDQERWRELRALAGDLRVLPFPITFVPIGSTSEILRQRRRDLGDTVGVELQRAPLSTAEHGAKRCIDVVGASLGLILIAPLLVAVAVAIKFGSPGPILFRQHRYGFNGRHFQIYKFRTMSVMEDGFTAVQARAADQRVTPIGKWLRKTSIDELPQLLNVLGGSMSLVGPRPHPISLDDQFDDAVRDYAFRRRVKPGLTGWAQIHGCRGPTPTTNHMERRVEHDLWYIDNWSVKLDLAILMRTPLEVIRGTNAY